MGIPAESVPDAFRYSPRPVPSGTTCLGTFAADHRIRSSQTSCLLNVVMLNGYSATDCVYKRGEKENARVRNIWRFELGTEISDRSTDSRKNTTTLLSEMIKVQVLSYGQRRLFVVLDLVVVGMPPVPHFDIVRRIEDQLRERARIVVD